MNVVIVEDDKVLSLLLSKMVERIGFTILDVIPKGRIALQQIRHLQPDLILMDIMLEDDMNGIDVMSSLRKQSVNTPVIYITGNSDPYNKKRAAATDYLDFLIKPVTFEELTNSLKKLA